MKYKPYILKPLFTMIKSGATIEEACEAVNIQQRTFFDWVYKRKGFSKKIDQLMRPRANIIKDIAFKKAREGNMEAIKYWLDKMSDWKDRQKVEHSGEVGLTMKGIADHVHEAKKKSKEQNRIGELADVSEN